MGSYMVLVYIVQATYTIALSWFIEWVGAKHGSGLDSWTGLWTDI